MEIERWCRKCKTFFDGHWLTNDTICPICHTSDNYISSTDESGDQPDVYLYEGDIDEMEDE